MNQKLVGHDILSAALDTIDFTCVRKCIFNPFVEEDSHYIIPVVPEPSVVTVGSRVVPISPDPEVVVL